MLNEPAAQAKAMVLAESPTQPATHVDAVDSLEDSTLTMVGHVAKRSAVTDENGSGLSNCLKQFDSEHIVFEDISPGGVLECPMEQTALKSLGKCEP